MVNVWMQLLAVMTAPNINQESKKLLGVIFQV